EQCPANLLLSHGNPPPCQFFEICMIGMSVYPGLFMLTCNQARSVVARRVSEGACLPVLRICRSCDWISLDRASRADASATLNNLAYEVSESVSTFSQRPLVHERAMASWTAATLSASAKPGSPCFSSTTDVRN